MANKKVYYYTACIKEIATNRDVTNNMRDIFNRIFNGVCVNNNGIRTMTLCQAKECISLDILFESENYLFARVGKAKDPSDAVIRDNATKRYEYVLTGEELENKTLEICTYFLLDYKCGIVGFILGKAAPSVQSLINIVNENDENHFMSIENIASPESIRRLMTPGATIGKIKYTFRVPDVDILRELGLTREQIVALGETDVHEIDLTIRNKPWRNLTSDTGVIQKVIDSFAVLPELIKDSVSITGKTRNSSLQPYKYDEQDIVYSIDVPVEKFEDGLKRKLTVDEVADEVLHKLRSIYIENKPHLLRFANLE